MESSRRKIRNFESLVKVPATGARQAVLRRRALEIVEAGLAAVDTESVIRKNVLLDGATLVCAGETIDLSAVKRLLVIGIGKCSAEAAGVLEEILGDRLAGGVVVDVHESHLKKLQTFSGTHPFPSERNIDATKAIIAALKGLSREDLVLFIVSGGGSALLCQPTNTTCLQEELLLKCMFGAGATIREINTVRKHLSLGRGGYLAAYAYPARVVSLIFSDVPGERPEFVASGPTMRDTTTVEDAKRVFVKYGLETRCGMSPDALIETPKEEEYFANVRNVVIVSNEIALEAMRRLAESFGFRTVVDPVGLNGEAKDRAASMVATLAAAGPGSAVLWGGEGTVTMQNGGKGGRNLEFALSALQGIRERQIIVSVASDGRDNTEFAGGIADTLTRDHAVQLNVEPAEFLRTHSSFDFFSKTGDYLMTGDTGSNVADLAIALYE